MQRKNGHARTCKIWARQTKGVGELGPVGAAQGLAGRRSIPLASVLGGVEPHRISDDWPATFCSSPEGGGTCQGPVSG